MAKKKRKKNQEKDQGWLIRQEDSSDDQLGILDHVDVASIPGSELWNCPCGRNGFTMRVENPIRRTEVCPDCGEKTLYFWPSGEARTPPG